MHAASASTQLCRLDCVRHQHRNREGTYAARHGRQGAGDFHNVGMNVADEHRAPPLERLEAFRIGREDPARVLGRSRY